MSAILPEPHHDDSTDQDTDMNRPEQSLDPAGGDTPESKRKKLMGTGTTYRDTPAHQVAALTWATVEVRDAIRDQTDANRLQADATAWNSELLQAQLAEMRNQNQMMYYINRHLFPSDVDAQLRVNLGISRTQPRAVVPLVAVDDFS